MNWFVLETEYGEEETVALRLADLKVEFYIPMVSHTFKSARNAPKCYAIETPLLPGLMFIHSIPYGINELPKVEGVWRELSGTPVAVPEWQLLRFKHVVSEYLDACRESFAKGKKQPAKPKELKFKLGDAGMRDAAMLKLFGVDEMAA